MTDRPRHGGVWSPWSAHLRVAWARGAIEHLAQRVGSRTVQGDQTRVRSVMASAGPTQEGSKALLQFGADLVGGAVGNLLHAIREQVHSLRLAQGDQGRDPG